MFLHKSARFVSVLSPHCGKYSLRATVYASSQAIVSMLQFPRVNLITTKQAAEHLGVSVKRVTALIRSGRLPAEKVGRDWLINARDLSKVTERKTGRPKKGAKSGN